MVTSLLLSAVLLAPSAPVPKATKPAGPPPKLLYVYPATSNTPVTVTVQTLRKVTETYTVNELVEGKPALKTATRTVEVPQLSAVTLDNTGATFKTADGKALTAADVSDRLKAGGVLFLPAEGDEVESAHLKLLAADALVAGYKNEGAEEKKTIFLSRPRVNQATPAVPTLLATKADEKGVLRVPAKGTREETVKVPVTKNDENGVAKIEYVDQKRTLTGLFPAAFDEVKPEVTTADGKPVAADAAKKQLAGGAIVLVSGDGKPVDEQFRKLFKPDTLILTCEKMALPARTAVTGGVKGLVMPAIAAPPVAK